MTDYPTPAPASRQLQVTIPELAFVAATRGLAGAGVGILASSLIKEERRKQVGLALLAIGVITTIPIAVNVFRRRMG